MNDTPRISSTPFQPLSTPPRSLSLLLGLAFLYGGIAVFLPDVTDGARCNGSLGCGGDGFTEVDGDGAVVAESVDVELDPRDPVAERVLGLI